VIAWLDTSVVVRYLTGDPPELADRAAAVIDGETELVLTSVVLAETAYVLTSVYGVGREVVVDHLIELLQKDNLSVADLTPEAAVSALLLCRPSGRVSFADALLWGAVRSAGDGVVVTFDERFPDAGVEVRRP